ncbi:MAG: restriction endonuclease subunit S [candidate division NC10 bacterium]|nr:restriction endonuclease subunit S [candidate division NC10 bacterium]
MRPVERGETPIPGTSYRQIGVKLWGEGAYEREPIDGGATKYIQLFRVAAGDVIVNKIWARNGSMAVVPDSLAGCFGSGEFPMFAPIRSHLEPRWFHWLTKTRGLWAQCDEKSQGTSGKNRIRPERFLEIEIPLPPLAEQRRIVTRIEELAARIEEARTLRQQAVEEGEAVCRAMITQDQDSRLTPVRELVRLRPTDVTVSPSEKYQFAGVYCFGRGVFRAEAKTGMDFAYPRLTRLKAGNFIYPKLMAWEGALAVAPPECDGCVVSTEFPVFEVLDDKVLPEVLDTYFRTPSVWPDLAGTSTGTNVRRRRLNPEDFLNYQMPLPSRPTQEKLRIVRERVDALKRLQAETTAKLDALLPSILDRAFAGAL